MKRAALLLSFLIILPGFTLFEKKGMKDIIQTGAVLEKLADSFLFTEGPAADREGNIFFTDQPNDRIMKWSISGELSTYLSPCGRSNGMAFDSKGNLWTCADEKNEIWCISQSKEIRVFPLMFGDKRMNGPNDLWIDKKGGVFFTDPFYKRTWWKHSEKPQETEAVYYLDPSNQSISVIAGDLEQPNGIVGSPDGKNLYVADIRAKKTWKYDIGEKGTLSNKRLFCEMGSDGMTIDSRGNIYLTGKGVTIFDRNGNKTGNIEVPENWTANVCFGDTDLKSLFITASKGLYRIRMKVKGTRG